METPVASQLASCPEHVSVVVITRDRPVDLERCLVALLASEFRDFKLVVVDQSRGRAAAEVVQRLAANDTRVTHLPDHGFGAARARNRGIAATVGEIIVFTDDDCAPMTSWLGSIVQALRDDQEAGMAYGAVIPAPHDPTSGFIVGFDPPRPQRLKGKLSKTRDAGISANLAMRRVALNATGGFDELLGPGSYFSNAEDLDLTYRVLCLGYAVLHCPEARVMHYGLREWQAASGLIRRTYIAIGAVYMKHTRLRDPVGVVLLAYELWLAAANIATHLRKRRGPFGLGRFASLFVGAWRSFELGVDRRHAVYTIPT
jgi:GT2 family glycosyltransferase